MLTIDLHQKAVYTNADYFLYGELNVVSIDEFQLFYDSETGQYGVYNGSYSQKLLLKLYKRETNNYDNR